MATLVARAFGDGRRVVVEAATGTGKTMAYLVPAVLSRKRTVVSTATKTLQEQILQKDVPLLQSISPRPFSAVLLKGRQNYLCLWAYDSFRQEPRFRRREDAHYWPAVERWAERTTTGDRGEIGALPDDWATWADLSMGSEACTGRDCVYYSDCFVTRARAAAQEADLIVVNHHLYFADLSIRMRTDAELLPAYEAVIFDEAHNLEETASGYFGVQVSSYRYTDLLTDVVRMMTREHGLTDAIRMAAASAGDRARDLFAQVAARTPVDGRVEAATVFDDSESGDELRDAHRALETRMLELRFALEGSAQAGEIVRRLTDRIDTLVKETSLLVERDARDLVYVVERRGRGVFVSAYPVDLSGVFREVLFSTCATQIFTSATLATDGDFRYFRGRMGIPDDTDQACLEPVFDYMQQALLYIPEALPDPTDPRFVEAVAPTIERLVQICDGRAFLLFTSYRNMREAHRILGPRLSQPILVQGDMSRAALLDAFRADPRTVLFATSSFWEGVDVQGEALSLVIIDKLPFASPNDPVLKARLDAIEAAGRSAFSDYQVPAAAITLKQGFGRLIRHRDDVGIIAILDGRIVRKAYGKRFLDSLPRARRTRDIDVVERWWTSRDHDAEA
ncbi:MAG: ATP-dependent DNA helicase [Myxococcales bacterium]|nr:ATP-dependent DNA helicase [Myxococcales bacterium]